MQSLEPLAPLPPMGWQAGAILGRGAMNATFVVHPSTPRAGVVEGVCKRLVPRVLHEASARENLAREAAVLTALAGRGAPRVLDAGDDGEGPYLVVELLAMYPLSHWFPPTPSERDGEDAAATSAAPAVDAAWLARVVRAAFRALDAVHAADDARGSLSVVHGDLSPGNVLVGEDGQEGTLVDFGLASFRDAPAPPLGTFRGTLRYAAPEQARGERIDAASDRFALAASLAHLALGVPARAAQSPAALLVEAAETPLDAYAEKAAARLPSDLGARLLRDLAFDRSLR